VLSRECDCLVGRHAFAVRLAVLLLFMHELVALGQLVRLVLQIRQVAKVIRTVEVV
jgi:hypothetical protein